MKFKYEIKSNAQQVFWSDSAFKEAIIFGLSTADKKFTIDVYNDAHEKIATAYVDVSSKEARIDRLELEKTFKERHRKQNVSELLRIKEEVLKELSKVILEANQKIKKEDATKASRVVSLLVEYRDIFIQYSHTASDGYQFIHENHNELFSEFYSQFVPLCTPGFQILLGDLYQAYGALDKLLEKKSAQSEISEQMR